MRIRISELREIADRLFVHLEETGRQDVEVSDDFYWSIDKGEVYNPLKDPTDLTLGQLTDDWKELKAICNGQSPPIGYALVWLSSILRNIGENSVH